MNFRKILSIITIILIALIVFLSRHELERAWELLSAVNVGLLLLTIPIIILGYYAVGEMVFTYLRAKHLIKELSFLTLVRLSLEMNFVNHVLPSGGVSGISYTSWRLGRYGVTSGKATMAQIIRHVLGFAAFIALLLIAVIIITVDGEINRWLILMSSAIVGVMAIATVFGVYLVGNVRRMHRFSLWFAMGLQRFIKKVSFGKAHIHVDAKKIERFLDDIHDDYLALKHDRRVLLKPFLWGVLFTLSEVAVFYVTFLALGTPANPAVILIAYGIATIAGLVVVTPGGAGAYEALMVMVLTFAGIESGTAIAGIVLARVIILLTTIIAGYIFYQHAIVVYGKHRTEPDTKV